MSIHIVKKHPYKAMLIFDDKEALYEFKKIIDQMQVPDHRIPRGEIYYEGLDEEFKE